MVMEPSQMLQANEGTQLLGSRQTKQAYSRTKTHVDDLRRCLGRRAEKRASCLQGFRLVPDLL